MSGATGPVKLQTPPAQLLVTLTPNDVRGAPLMAWKLPLQPMLCIVPSAVWNVKPVGILSSPVGAGLSLPEHAEAAPIRKGSQTRYLMGRISRPGSVDGHAIGRAREQVSTGHPAGDHDGDTRPQPRRAQQAARRARRGLGL